MSLEQCNDIEVTIQPRTVLTVTLNVGPRGSAGQDGVDGADGAAGADGADGADGTNGAAGPPIVEINTYGAPSLLETSGAVPAPVNQRERRYIRGNVGAKTGLTIAAPADMTRTWELELVGVNDTNYAQFVSSANVLLSGTWVAKLGSISIFHWLPGLNRYVEATRNGI